MKNKVKLKQFLIIFSNLFLILIFIFIIINIYLYKSYNKNFNIKLTEIIYEIKEKYPKVSDDEIINILTSKNKNDNLFKKYNIYLDDIIISNNKSLFSKIIIINTLFVIFIVLIFFISFLLFNKKKDREIDKITKYVKEINKGNYKLNIDEMSEDELSILKSEIYKTTIMLKESSKNANKEKIELKDSLSDISHQLKTPLTSILIILDNLMDDPNMNKEVRDDFIKDIKREVNNISFLVQSILKLSKFDTNTIDFIEENVFLKDIINDAIEKLLMLSDLKNISFNFKIDNNIKIKCDYKWQVEAISNILKNCIEYAKINSTIEIIGIDNMVYTEIKISDIGVVIDKKDINHIFERFYKGKNALPDSIGIGLSLAKAIINKDNGTISVKSSNNKTTFIIKYYK